MKKINENIGEAEQRVLYEICSDDLENPDNMTFCEEHVA